MKKILIVVVLLLFSFLSVLQAQNQTVRELGVKTHDFNRYQLTYKWGNTQSMWRISIDPEILHSTYNERTSDSLRYEYNDGRVTGDRSIKNYDVTNTTYDFRVSIGKEFLLPLSDKCTFIYGVDLVGNYLDNPNYRSTINRPETTILIAGIHPIAGMFYRIDNHIIFGVEFSPSINYRYYKYTSKSVTTTYDRIYTSERSDIQKGINYAFSSQNLFLSLSYRF